MPETYNASSVTYDAASVDYDGDPYVSLPFPIVGVYIAWNDGPYVANPGWTEITPYVRAVSTRRGRSDDFEQFDTGTAQLVLDNRDRRFDPFYTSGPYYLKLTPRRQIRIVGQANGVNYDIFRGFVAGWPVTWTDAGYDSTVTIQAFDALGLMAGEVVPTDWVYTYTKSLNPRHYWRGSDSRGSQTISDDGAVKLPMSRTTVNVPYFFEQPSLAEGLPGTSSAVINYWTSSLANAPVMANQNLDFSVSGWLEFSGTASGVSGFEMVYATNGLVMEYYQQVIGTRPVGYFHIFLTQPTGIRYYSVTVGQTATLPHFWTINYTAATNSLTIYQDGQNITGTLTTGGGTGSGSYDQMRVQGCTFQELCVFDRNLTFDEHLTLFNFGSARVTETTTARMNRLIGTTEWSPLLTGFTSTPAAAVSEIGTGTGVVPEMQLVADSEGGSLYVSKAGILTMTNRTDVFNAPRSSTPQATITDSGAGLKYGTELSIEYDADALSNDVTVTFSGNGEVNAYSDAVIEAYGAAATTIETQLADPTSASQLATRQLGVQGSLVPRISPIDLSVNTSQTDWQTILGLELLDRVTFKRTPTVGNQFSREALVNAIEHTIEPGSWSTSVQLSMRYTSPLVLDDDVLGTLDFNYLG